MDKATTQERFKKLKTREDVASLIEISDRSLRYFLYKRRPENLYVQFSIPKGNGDTRTISAPVKAWREVQRKLANVLSEIYEPKVCAYGFIKERNHIANAEKHAHRQLILNIDLKDFFNQIHFGRICGMLINKPYSIGREAAITIAQIACLNGQLPQGAPTSPILSNMICVPLDNAMMSLAKGQQFLYTRYADDITLSTYKKTFDHSIVYMDSGRIEIGDKLRTIFEKQSFQINPQKIFLCERSNRQEVTGLTVNAFPNLRRSYLRQLRAILHSCGKFGVINAARHYIKSGLCKNPSIIAIVDRESEAQKVIQWFELVLKGKIQYVKQVKGARSFTYLSFARKMNKAFDREIFDLTELREFDRIVENSTFILEYCDEKDDDDYVQGSAFYLTDIGLLTSYHVTENEAFFKIYTSKLYGVSHIGLIGKGLREISSDENLDYALYKLPHPLEDKLTFRCGDSRYLRTGDKVTIVGYPNYQKGNSAYVQPCVITSTKTYMGAKFFTVSGRIVHGASGGVVLNSDNEAIGIIKGGIVSLNDDDQNENQGFVPLHLVLEHIQISKDQST